ncbi:uncharacterized protein KGF55_001184 [Candida pseudojiufengensis]|uniref:uncharacterized protein n=1 Tax=Candida pseudojiufengensis TaxID=497109 RepID=UPI0022251440|nr:uncharacterized protein KGF55_001184 [Candida pseudojiufengensis]KAI5965821.1 hypothetical protein KGF55_001184 [Candida pseudojiufengensis]
MFKFDTIDDSRPKLPDSIKIDDITSGKIDPKLIYEEIERLKAETNILRNDMSSFLRALTTTPKDNSQKEFFQTIITRLATIQQSINEYCERYNKLLPIINLAQIKLGHEVEAPPNNVKIKGSNPSSTNNTPNMGNKPSPMISSSENTNAASTTPNQNSNYPTPNNGSININSNKITKKGAKKGNFPTNIGNGKNQNTSANNIKSQNGTSSSPIVI